MTQSDVTRRLDALVMPSTPKEVHERYRTLAKRAQETSFGPLEEDFVVLDTETTGLSFRDCELIEIAAARISGKEVVDISFAQMHQFAGNMLELRNDRGEKLLIMSLTAKNSLTPQQMALLETDVRIVAPDIDAIETAGGGSARCMIAEIYE